MYKKFRVRFEDTCGDESFIGIVEIDETYDEYNVINVGFNELVDGYNEDVDASLEAYLYENYQYVDGVTDFWVERIPMIDFTIEW